MIASAVVSPVLHGALLETVRVTAAAEHPALERLNAALETGDYAGIIESAADVERWLGSAWPEAPCRRRLDHALHRRR